ncbi:protein kinase [bacterium]|nr:protein kinase [bacterium]
MSTFKCPNCQAELPEFQKAAGNCPYCDAKWDSEPSQPDAADNDQTIQFDSGQLDSGSFEIEEQPPGNQTMPLDGDQDDTGEAGPMETIELPNASQIARDLGSLPPEDTSETREIPPEDISATIAPGSFPEDNAGDDDPHQTIQHGVPGSTNQTQPTIELPPGNDPDSMQTLDIDASNEAAKRQAHTMAFQLSDDDNNQTIDIDDPNRPVSDADLHVTFGSQPLSPSDMKRYWGNEDGSPMQTMRTATVSKAKQLGVDLSRRVLSDKEEGSDYAIINQLGKGGMGVVYAAKQKSLSRRVAVKTLKREIGQREDDRAKFLSEAVITGVLDHPNIVPIHELGQTEDGTLFYSMKCVTGTEWHKVIRHKSEAENLEIFLKVADAVAFAHSKNVIHRDLKPENVMLGEYGEVLVMDWGLAVNLSRKEEFTMGGTPAYMAPEMARGPLEKIGKCSDIYLLGAMLYEIVTGFPPHAASSVTECLVAAAQNVIVKSESTSRLKNIALRAMATSPKLRFNSVALLQEEVRKYQSTAQSIELTNTAQSELETARENDSYELFSRAMFGFEDALMLWPENDAADRGFRESRQDYAKCALKKADFDLGLQLLNPDDPDEAPIYQDLTKAKASAERTARNAKRARVVAVGSMLFALIGAGIGLFVINGLRQKADEAATIAKEKAEEARISEEKATGLATKLKDERDKLEKVNNDLDKKSTALVTANGELKQQSDQIKQQNDQLAKQRDDLAMALIDVAQERNRARFAAMFASVGLAQSKVESNDISSALSLLESIDQEYRGWEWKHLAYLCHPDVPHIDLPQAASAVAISRDGNWTAIGTNGDGVYIYPTDTATDAGVMPSHLPITDCHITCLNFSDDGRELWIGTDNPQRYLQVWPMQGKPQTVTLKNLNPFSTYPAVSAIEFIPGSPGTAMVAVSGRCFRINQSDLSSTSLVHVDNVFDLSISPDGTHYVHAQESRGEYRAKINPVNGSQADPIQLQTDDRIVHCAYLSPDHIALALGDGSLEVWTVSQQKTQIYFALPGQTNRLRFDPKTNLLAAALADGSIELFHFEPHSGGLRHYKTLRGHQGTVLDCALDPKKPKLISVSEDKTARFWDYKNYQDRLELDLANSVLWAGFSESGRQFVTGDRSGQTQVWSSTESGDKPLLVLSMGDWINQNIAKKAASVPLGDGKHMVTADPNVGVTVWEIATQRAVWHDRTQGGSYRVAAVPATDHFIYLDVAADGKGGQHSLIRCSDSHGKTIFNVQTTFDLNQVQELAVAPSGHYLGIRSRNGVKVYRTPSAADKQLGQEVWKVDSGIVRQIAFRSDNQLLLGYNSGRNDGYLEMVDFISDRKLQRFPTQENGLPFLQFALSPDNSHLVMTYNDTLIAEVEGTEPPESKQTVISLFALDQPERPIQQVTCTGLAAFPSITADLKHVYFVQQHRPGDHDVGCWQVGQQECQLLQFARKGTDATSTAARVAVMVDVYPEHPGEILVSYSNRDVELWDLAKQQSVARMAPTRGVIFCGYINQDRQIVSVHDDGLVRVWDGQSGLMIREYDVQYQTLQAASLEGDMLAVGGSAGFVSVIDLAKEAIVANVPFGDASIDSLVWVPSAPQQSLMVASSRLLPDADGSEHLVGTLQRIVSGTWTLAGESFAQHAGRYRSLAVSKDGTRFVATSSDRFVRLWADLSIDQWAMTKPRILEGHSTDVTAAAFSTTGQRLVTGSFDGALTVWFIDRPKHPEGADDDENKPMELHIQQFVPLKGHRKEISSIMFSPDSRMLLTSSIDRSAILWFTTDLPDENAKVVEKQGLQPEGVLFSERPARQR